MPESSLAGASRNGPRVSAAKLRPGAHPAKLDSDKFASLAGASTNGPRVSAEKPMTGAHPAKLDSDKFGDETPNRSLD